MDYTTLGRTGLRVSRLGLGGGGHSQLGRRAGIGEDQSVAIVRRALDRGVNFIDTSEVYGTEEIVGRGIVGRRDDVVLCTKKTIGRRGEFIRPEQVAEGLEGSLRRLNTDRVEIYLLHGVLPDEYSYARDELVGELDKLREAGKIGYIGITEAFNTDRDHGTLRRAVDDGWPDVIMVGFNMLNQCARETIFPVTREKGIGVLDMFVVRQALHDPAMLRRTVERLIDAGSIPADGIDRDDPLGFVLGEGAAESLPDAAYRFCRDEHGVDVVLTGTGNVAHLEANIDAIERPPLPTEVRQRLVEMFDGVDCVSGQEPPLRESYSA